MAIVSPSAEDPVQAGLVVCDAARTAALLDFHDLIDEIARVAPDYDAGHIASPERLVVPLGDGGVMLSMPAAAHDIGIHKLVNVQPANTGLGLPTIHGIVTVCESASGRPLCLLDGPEVTGRRTAAVSLLGIRALWGRAPEAVLLIGTGTQARHHLHALRAVYPQCRIWVRGRNIAATEAFCEAAASDRVTPCAQGTPPQADVVITLTTSTAPVYDEPARADRLVIGVGAFKPEMAELGPTTLHGSDLYADDPTGARHEAGDLLRAGVDWNRVCSLATALRQPHDPARPAVFKSVGTAAWDLAAARVALRALAAGR
uniref:bifunctional Delta(1)-pyrroline-2-carboxylate/Delta(1)-piperideine-2- carboxylate reductase n=1 Tax=Castellaniella defragrans TaxID=75697 RepID=UPI003340BDF5